MKQLLMTSALVMATALPSFAEDNTYTTEELVTYFVNSINLGTSRGICIGTAQECAPKEAPKGLDMRVTFELDSANLTQEAKDSLNIFADMMRDDRLAKSRFSVEGHTDARGTETYNTTLSQDRAASVKTYLTSLGIEPFRLNAMGLGETQPRVDDPMDPENRRVELRVELN